MKELWLPVKGFEGLYEISNTGKVKALSCNKYKGRYIQYCHERLLKHSKKSNGYLQVVLQRDKNKRYISVHNLVAVHFVNNDFNKPCVNHKDGNKENNNFYNLEYVTYKENINHADITGLRKAYGENTKQSKLNNLIVIQIRRSSLPVSKLALIYNVHKSCIFKIIKKQTWKHV